MSTLGPDARALVQAGRRAARPTAADRERVLQAVQQRVTAGAAGTAAAAPALTKSLLWPWGSLAVVGLAVVGGLVMFSTRDEVARAAPSSDPIALAAPAVAGQPAADSAAAAVVSVNQAPVVAPADLAPAPLVLEPAVASKSRAARSSDRLAEEVAILERAEAQLHAGRHAAALTVLDEHRRKFPKGALAQERVAARVQALCALGRVDEADRELGILTRLSPSSPHEGRARAACAGRAK